MKRVYEQVMKEIPRIEQMVSYAVMANVIAADPASQAARELAFFRFGRAIQLGVAVVLNFTLRVYQPENPNYLDKAYQLVDDTITLAYDCEEHRPFGSSFCQESLKIVWAAAPDRSRCLEIEELMMRYQEDVVGGAFLEEAHLMRERLLNMERIAQKEKMDASLRSNPADKNMCMVM